MEFNPVIVTDLADLMTDGTQLFAMYDLRPSGNKVYATIPLNGPGEENEAFEEIEIVPLFFVGGGIHASFFLHTNEGLEIDIYPTGWAPIYKFHDPDSEVDILVQPEPRPLNPA